MTDPITRLVLMGVRRYGEDSLTPIVLDHRNACGTFRDHIERGCIGILVNRRGAESLLHLTDAEALRLSDLLRAMAETNEVTP